MTGDTKQDCPGLVRSRCVHQGRRIQVAVDLVRMPDGSTSELDMVRHPGAAAVVAVFAAPDTPVTLDHDVVLIRQYRYAAGGYIYEIPAGIPDYTDEPWHDCARRELEEETGLVASSLDHLTAIYTTPGFTDEVIHIFLATGLSKGEINLDTDEFIDVHRLPLREAVEMVREGKVRDAKSVVGILHMCSRVSPGDGMSPEWEGATPSQTNHDVSAPDIGRH